MKPEDCIFYLLAKTNQAGNKVWKKAMSGFNVTAVQGMILNFLAMEDHITSKELGERTMLDSATLTGILDRLEKADLIERRHHPTDRRAITVCLTGEGKVLVTDTFNEAIRANLIFLECLSDDEQQSFRAILQKLRDNAPSAFEKI